MTAAQFRSALIWAIAITIVVSLVAAFCRAAIAVSHADSAITASAWLIGALGFALTLWQLRKTQAAAESAKIAVAGVKEAIKNYDTLTEIGRASGALESLAVLHRQRDWPHVHDRYVQAKRALASVRTMHSELTEPQRAGLDAAIEQINEMDFQVEDHLINGSEAPDVAKFNIVISQLTDDVNEIALNIKKRHRR